MCGLAGVAGDLTNKDTDIFKELLFLSQVRGHDATGVATYHIKSKEYDVFKRAVPSSTFLDLRRVDTMITPRADVIMGHTRKSTGDWQSKFSHDDAHPFEWNNIIGMHNGMIPFMALEKMKHKLKGSIDSEQLIYNISKDGIDGVLPNIWGAWALSLLDVENQKLGFVRNSQRPFAYAFTKDKKKMYWASEGPMLFWMLNRWGIELEAPYPHVLEEDTFIEFNLGSGKPIGESFTKFKVQGGKEPEKKPSAPTTPTGTVATHSGSKKTLTPAEAALKVIEGMEMQLISFDYSARHKWSKLQRKRFDSLIKSLNRAYKEWATGSFIQDIKELEEKAPTKEEWELAGKTHAELVKTMLADKGCAFCCKDSVEDHELEQCGIGSSEEVLCNVCNADECLRAIAQVKPPVYKHKH